jgi:hypothetical protein
VGEDFLEAVAGGLVLRLWGRGLGGGLHLYHYRLRWALLFWLLSRRKLLASPVVISWAMAYFIDLFSPETYEAFKASSRDISGFRLRQKSTADRIQVGDIFVCYMTRLSRWFGLLEVVDGPFIDNAPIFVLEDDPFVVRFHVRPVVLLSPTESIPIHDAEIWNGLSFTKDLELGSLAWTGKVRSSLAQLSDQDGQFLEVKLKSQAGEGKTYPLSEDDVRKLATHTVNRSDKVIAVSVPEDSGTTEEADAPIEAEARESIRIQALIANIGISMGLSIWVPRNDRAAVLKELNGDAPQLLDRLPLNYDDTTLRTIEQIDVLWLRGRSIARAFEVEHTTSVYSGILRMADLLALQPNMDIRLHIVAPLARRDKVFSEIRRPVFSLLDRGPLAESCTYLSYDSLREVAAQKHVAYLSDKVLDEYSEDAE